MNSNYFDIILNFFILIFQSCYKIDENISKKEKVKKIIDNNQCCTIAKIIRKGHADRCCKAGAHNTNCI